MGPRDPFDFCDAFDGPVEPPDAPPPAPSESLAAFQEPTEGMLNALEQSITGVPWGPSPLRTFLPGQGIEFLGPATGYGDKMSQIMDVVEDWTEGRVFVVPPDASPAATAPVEPEQARLYTEHRTGARLPGPRPLPVSGDGVSPPSTAMEPAHAARLYFTRDGLNPPSYHPMGGSGAKVGTGSNSATTRLCPASHDFVTRDACESCENWRDWAEDGTGKEQCHYDWEAEKAADGEHEREDEGREG